MLTIKIQTHNAAFQDGNRGNECAELLRQIAASIERSHNYDAVEEGTVRDYNGNTVGFYKLTAR